MSENENIELNLRKTPKQPAPVELPPSPDDTGSQALSEALQSSFFIVKLAMVVLVLFFLGSGFFTVGPQQQAIKLRFGKPVGEGTNALLGPGFHWALPRPIDEVTNISIGQFQVAESTVGWYAVDAQGNPVTGNPPPPSINPAAESYALTSDANIIHVHVSMRYRITDPISYLFDYVNAATFVTNALNNAVLFASANYSADEALTRKVEAFRETVSTRVEELLRTQKLGIKIEQIDVKTVPPRQLDAAFRAVSQSSVDRQKTNTLALAYSNSIISEARGKALAITNTANAEYTAMIADLRTEETNFLSQLPRYQTNPILYAELLQVQTMRRVLTNAQERMFIPSRMDGKPRQLWLQLNREPKPSASTPAQQ
jgi:membrane protease subunit HflK